MEKYLGRQYNVMNSPEVKSVLDIEDYFIKNGHKFFDINDDEIPPESMERTYD